MHLTNNPFASILAVSGLATIALAVVIYTRLRSIERSFALVIGLAGYWAVTYSGELYSTTLPTMFLWVKLQYLGITLLGPALLFFIRVFIAKDNFVTRPYHAWILIVPIITIALVFTNGRHHLYYTSLSVDRTGSFPLLKITPSMWYYLFTVYFYVTMVWSVYSLLAAFKRVDKIYQKQKHIILYALMIPWICNIIYKVGIGPNQNLDLTPFAFIATSFIISFGLLRYQLLDIIPAARQQIFETMQDGVLVLDVSGKVIDKNRQMDQLLPKPASRIVGAPVVELTVLGEKLQAAIATRKKTVLEIAVENGSETSYLEVAINVLQGRSGEYSGCILIFHDITQQKRDAIDLIALNDLKDRLFSIIAHDLRSPLINITEMIRLVDEQEITEKEFKLYLPELSKNLNYTSSLLDNLLHWSRSQLKGEMVTAVKVDLGKITRHEIGYYQQKAKEKGIWLVNEVEEATWVFADAEMIQLVIRNLIGNAIKYCVREDKISVSVTFDSYEEVTVCISDTGSGMKPEIVSRLFMLETFTTRGTNNEQGTGLGLQLCKDFVEKNNGNIWVNTSLGVGSNFYFTVPLAAHTIVAAIDTAIVEG